MSNQIANLNADYSYFNFYLTNDTEQPIEARFNEERNIPIISRIEDFQVGVARFRLPLASVPLMQFNDDQYAIGFTVGVGDTDLIYKKVNYDEELVSDDPDIVRDRFIFHYQQILDMINEALAAAWAQACADYPFLATDFDDGYPPLIKLDDTSSYLVFHLPFGSSALGPTYVFASSNGKAPNKINIYISPKLELLLSGFPVFYSTNAIQDPTPIVPPYVQGPPLQYRLQFDFAVPKFTPPASYIVGDNWYLPVFQDYTNLYLFQDLARILLVTNMPIEQENIGVSNYQGQPLNINVLTDFEVPGDTDGNLRDYLFYQPSMPRYANFNSNGVLRKMSLQIYYQNNNLKLFPLKILPGQQATIKLQFKRRKAYDLLQYSGRDNNLYR